MHSNRHVFGLARKPEYLDKTHTDTGRTFKLHTEIRRFEMGTIKATAPALTCHLLMLGWWMYSFLPKYVKCIKGPVRWLSSFFFTFFISDFRVNSEFCHLKTFSVVCSWGVYSLEKIVRQKTWLWTCGRPVQSSINIQVSEDEMVTSNTWEYIWHNCVEWKTNTEAINTWQTTC